MPRILALFALTVGTITAQTAVLEQNRCAINITSNSTNTQQFDNRDAKCISFTFSYYSTGFSALSVEVDGAPDATTNPNQPNPGSWVLLQSITGVTLTGSNPLTNTAQESATFYGYAPWVRIRISSVTGSGKIGASLYGDRNGQGGTGGGGGGGGGCTSPCPVEGVDAIGATPTVPPVFTGGVDSAGHILGEQFCTQTALIALTGSGETQIIAASGTTHVRICRMSFTTSANVNVQVDYGTGSNCGTGTTHFTGLYSSIATFAEPTNNSYWVFPAGQAVCLSQSGSSTTGGSVTYAQY